MRFALDSRATQTVMGQGHAEQRRDEGGSREQERCGVRDCDWGTHPELVGEEVSRPSVKRACHCPGMRSKQGPDEREEGDAGWQPSGV